MNSLEIEKVCDYVNHNIVEFHNHRIKLLEGLNLEQLLRKNHCQ
jgi:hypothetical protein